MVKGEKLDVLACCMCYLHHIGLAESVLDTQKPCTPFFCPFFNMIIALIALKLVFIKYIINIYCAGTALSLVATLGHELSQVGNQQNVMCVTGNT